MSVDLATAPNTLSVDQHIQLWEQEQSSAIAQLTAEATANVRCADAFLGTHAAESFEKAMNGVRERAEEDAKNARDYAAQRAQEDSEAYAARQKDGVGFTEVPLAPDANRDRSSVDLTA